MMDYSPDYGVSCKDCKWYNEDLNGLCEMWARFKSEKDDACERFEEE